MEPGWISIIPALLAVILAFITRDAVISLALACIAGVILMGQGIQGFPALITRALGNEDFIWICGIEFCIGILIAFFQRSGAVDMFSNRAQGWATNRKRVGTLGWGMGLFIFFSDYFSPLFVGPVMRNLTDRFRISREKLAYICDSTSAPLVVLVPITGWAAYLSGLAIGHAGIGSREEALKLFLHSIPFNFYAFLAVIMVLLVVLEIVPDFGPMKRAEERTRRTGKVLRDGAVPMMGKELTQLEASSSPKPGIILNFLLPVFLIITVNISTFVLTGRASVLESFMLACAVLGVTMWIQRVDDLAGIMKTVYAGMKGVMPAVIILALAYCINTVSREMGTAEFVVNSTQGWMSPVLLPLLLFLISSFVSFSTGTSWGTYAIMIPIALPLAYQFAGQEVGTLVWSSFAAVAGGGVFGDHCSPLSDTTVLSSLGSACDHIDHVKTQLPYTLTVAVAVSVLYILVGIVL
ncbi:MAG: transporter [Candidatus Latescibacteria bacterium]|nr:transporter [Candidatus Latescibacterota bacterium]